jgi:thioredoxin 1
MSVLKVTKENFNKDVKNSERTVLLDFYATWCGPCRMVGPIMEEISDQRPDLLVGKVNVDEEPELARAFGVTSIPMLAVMKDGILVDAVVGARPKESILELVDG